MRSDQRPQRLGLALGDAAGGLVEQHDRRAGGPSTQARSTMRRRAGRQLVHELRAERADAEQLDRARRPGAASGVSVFCWTGRRNMAFNGSRASTNRSSATLMVSSTVSAGNRRASWNERPRPRRARAVGPEAGDVVAVEHAPGRRRRRGEARDEVEQRGLAGAVGSDDAEDLAGRHRQRHVVDGPDPTEAHRQVERSSIAAVRARAPVRRRASAGAAPGDAGDVGAGVLSLSAARWAAAPSRNTERSTSGRSSSSDVGPWKRISPFSMKYARSARVRATLTDCSTRITVVPAASQLRLHWQVRSHRVVTKWSHAFAESP